MTLESDLDVQKVIDRVVTRSPSSAQLVSNLVASRRRHQIEFREIERGMQRLAAIGVTQRDIAALAGLSQAEVSRRLKRNHLSTDVEKLRGIVRRRADHDLSSDEMINAIVSAIRPRRAPGRVSAYDGSSSSSPAVAEVMKLYKSGSITKAEYMGVRTRLADRKKSR